ncbi:hypothetical protein [Schleiferilactobacillus shenzhenensis]|nr:hypothetical protein [Schleiferilactobacillus shenzhenensis]
MADTTPTTPSPQNDMQLIALAIIKLVGTDNPAINKRIDDAIAAIARGDGDTLTAAKQYADKIKSDLVNGAPQALDTLKELADSLTGDNSQLATLLTQVGDNAKAIKANGDTIATLKANTDLGLSDDQRNSLKAYVGVPTTPVN